MKRFILIFISLASLAQAQYRPANSNAIGSEGYNTTKNLGGEGLLSPSDNLPSYDPDAQAFFNRTSGMTELEMTAVNYVFSNVNTLSPGLLDSLGDVLVLPRFFSSSSNAVLNWLGDWSNATIVNSMSFTTHTGFTGNGTTSYLNSNHNPSTFAGEYQLNSNCFGVLICSDVANSNMNDLGVYDGTSAMQIIGREATNNFFSTNNNTNAVRVASTTSSILYLTSVRTSSTGGAVYKNTTGTAYSTTSNTVPNRLVYIGGYNFNGVLLNASTRTIGGYWIGGKLSAAQINTLVTSIEGGLDILSAGIIAMIDNYELRFYGHNENQMPANVFELYSTQYRQAM